MTSSVTSLWNKFSTRVDVSDPQLPKHSHRTYIDLVDIYDEPEGDGQEDDIDADDRIAEQFKQDFMDAMQARQRNRTAGQPKAPNLKPGEQPPPRGPKLGGSRSARAAMREQQEKALKK
jgi:hypothetical protein